MNAPQRRRPAAAARRPFDARPSGACPPIERLEWRTLLTAAPTLVGSAIPVTSSGGNGPVVAMAAGGSFAVGSVSAFGTSAYRLTVQRYTSGGSATGSSFLADDAFGNLGGLAGDGPGDLVALDDTSGSIYLNVVQAGGTTLTVVQVAGGGTSDSDRAGSVAVDAAGHGVATYFDGDSEDMMAVPFTLASAGTALTVGTTFDLGESFSDIGSQTVTAAVAPDGTLGFGADNGQYELFQTYTAAGAAKSSLVQVEADSPSLETPTLTVDAHGVFTAAWPAEAVASNGTDTYDTTGVQQYASGGTVIGSTRNIGTTFGGTVVSTREGVVTLVQGGTLTDFDLAVANPSAGTTVASGGYVYQTATDGTGSAVVVYDDPNVASPLHARRVSIPTPTEAPYSGTAFAVGQTIEAENYNSGGEGTAYHDLDAAQLGSSYRLDSGVDVQASSSASNGHYVGYGQAGEYTDYTVKVATTGTYDVAFAVRGPVSGSTAATGGQFHADFNGTDKTGTLTVASPSTAFGTVAAKGISLSAGTYVVRVVLDKNATGSNATMNFDSFKITAATTTPTPTPTKLTGTTFGTAGSYGNSGNTIAKATDGSLSTYFDGPDASGDSVGLDLGSARAVTQIKFAPRSGYASRMTGGTFQASNSSTFAAGVVTVYTVSSAPTSGSLTTVTPTTATAYRYWRYVSPTGGHCDIAEFQLYGTAAGPARLSGTTFGTAGSYGGSTNTIAKATDGSLSTYFDGPDASGDFVGVDLGSAKAVKQIEFAPRGGYASRMVGGVFQASNSSTFASGVVTADTVSSAPASGLTTVAVTTTTAYRYWRYVGPTGGHCDVAEFELFG